MIGKISMGSSFSGCIRYCLEDKKQELSQEAIFKNRAELIVFNQCFGDKKELAEQFNDVRFIEQQSKTNVFYFDRINRAAIDLAKVYKKEGAIIFFEPSSIKDLKGFNECVEMADVIKFSDDRIEAYDHLFPIAVVSLEIQTMGTKGLKFRKKDDAEWTLLQGYSIQNVVDAAGAGDWCTAGVITSLFKEKRRVKDIEEQEIVCALKFGQALSALNCTFEGARGLMYNIKRHELLLYIKHILSSNVQFIPERRTTEKLEIRNAHLKISSLFAAT